MPELTRRVTPPFEQTTKSDLSLQDEKLASNAEAFLTCLVVLEGPELNHQVAHLDKAFEQLSGYTRDELLGRPFPEANSTLTLMHISYGRCLSAARAPSQKWHSPMKCQMQVCVDASEVSGISAALAESQQTPQQRECSMRRKDGGRHVIDKTTWHRRSVQQTRCQRLVV